MSGRLNNIHVLYYTTHVCACTVHSWERGARNWREIKRTCMRDRDICTKACRQYGWPLTQYPLLAGCASIVAEAIEAYLISRRCHGLSCQTSARDSSWSGIWCRPTLLRTLVHWRGSVRDGLVSRNSQHRFTLTPVCFTLPAQLSIMRLDKKLRSRRFVPLNIRRTVKELWGKSRF